VCGWHNEVFFVKFIFFGLLAGLVVALLPLTVAGTGISLTPAWHADKTLLDRTSVSTHNFPDIRYVALHPDGTPVVLDGNGTLVRSFTGDGTTLYSFASDGSFYCTYSKTGDEITLNNTEGARFWAVSSSQYPLVSTHGSLVVLQVADMGTLYLLDKNGKKIDSTALTGRFCTSIVFSDNEWLLAGFASSDYYVVNNKGVLVHELKTPEKTMVKSAAISPNALFAAVHFGDENKDGVLIVDCQSGTAKTVELKNCHITRTALLVEDSGECYILNGDELLSISKKGQITSRFALAMQKPGLASLAKSGSFLFAGYVREDGVPTLRIFSTGENPVPLASLDFPDERALRCSAVGNLVIAEGIRNLYTWYVQ